MKNILTICILVYLFFTTCDRQESLSHQGLIGAYYGDADFTNIKYPEILHSLDNQWDESTGHGSAWSGRYEGYLVSPFSGPVTFCLQSNKETVLISKLASGIRIT